MIQRRLDEFSKKGGKGSGKRERSRSPRSKGAKGSGGKEQSSPKTEKKAPAPGKWSWWGNKVETINATTKGRKICISFHSGKCLEAANVCTDLHSCNMKLLDDKLCTKPHKRGDHDEARDGKLKFL